MNQREFAKEVANKFDDVSPEAVRAILKAMTEVITDAIMDEDSVVLFPGFTIYGRRTKSFESTKAISGERYMVPSRIEPVVKIGRNYRVKVREGFKDDTDQ